MKVLIVGAGVSCDIIASKLLQSNISSEIYCWPRTSPANSKIQTFPLGEYATTTELANAADKASINLVILASADAVQSGLANVLEIYRIPCFGPTRVASHFQWDRECLRQSLDSCDAQLIDSDEAMLDSDHSEGLMWGVKTSYLAFVHGVRAQTIGLVKEGPEGGLVMVEVPHYIANIERDIVDPLIKGLYAESSPYSGFLTLEVVILGEKLHVGSTNFIEDIEVLETIIKTDSRDWLTLIRNIMGINERPPKLGNASRSFAKPTFC
jgi:phosphoribosylamine-glycine ligase